MFQEGKLSLHEAISTEIDRNYRMIDLVGKHYASIFIGILSLIGIIGITTFINFFSEWILASNIFFVIVVMFFFFNKRLSIDQKQGVDDTTKEVSEKQQIINLFMIFDSSMTYLESIVRTLGVIILINLLIVLLYASEKVIGNFSLLQNNILEIIPASLWFVLQALSFFIIIWFFTRSKLMRFTFRFSYFRFSKKTLSTDFQKMVVPKYVGIPFLLSVAFFTLSIPITIFSLWNSNLNWALIVAIIIIQTGIYAILNDFFSANVVLRKCFLKIYQLNMAQTMIEEINDSSDKYLSSAAEEIYHTTRLFIPIKTYGCIFLSNYLMIPNIAYWKDEYQDLLIRYITAAF